VLATGTLTAFDILQGRMPSAIFAPGQILIGYNIGTRFQRDALQDLPRVAAVGVVVIVAMIAVMALYSVGLEYALGLDFATGMLGSSPGGTAEMAATAQILHLSVALITAFHITRSILVNGFATYYWRGLSAIGYLPVLDRLLSRLFDTSKPT
jgi:uncharacterized protein